MNQHQRQRMICGLVSIGACLMFWLGCQVTEDDKSAATLVNPSAEASVSEELEPLPPGEPESEFDGASEGQEPVGEPSEPLTTARSTEPVVLPEPMSAGRSADPVSAGPGQRTAPVDHSFDTSAYLDEVESIYSTATRE
jgi:hypothetical protein